MKRRGKNRTAATPWLGLLCLLGWPVLVSAASIDVMAAKDRSFCERVTAYFGTRLTPDVELLKTVEWQPVELKGQGPKTRHCSALDRAVLDFNNDGRPDLIVKTTFCMKGAPSDSIYVFPAGNPVLDQLSWQDLSPLLATPDKFERTGGVYPLTLLHGERAGASPALKTLFTIQPFVLDGRTYVSLTDNRREWMVIATYVNGERFDDQCYLRAGTF